MLSLPPSHGACPQIKGGQAYESVPKSEAAVLKSKVDRLIREKAEQQVCCLSQGCTHIRGCAGPGPLQLGGRTQTPRHGTSRS
jgi:hypothetical protein